MARLYNLELQSKLAISYFNSSYAKYGSTVKALGWGSEFSQQKRFEILAGVGDLRGQRILDVGCGFGDFFGFLQKTQIDIREYLGIDINKNLLEIAITRYPTAHFQRRNILLDPMRDKFDFVFASGLFFMKIERWTEFMRYMLTKMFDLTGKALGINFLSAYSRSKKFANSKYPYPSEIIDFIAEYLSHRFTVRHDYLPNDFTVYIFK